VKLLNTGDDAFKPEYYGNEIAVERKITRQGTATYTISGNKDRRNISHERAELERILQNFNIFVDNPCCILTQEQSKTFINGQCKEKYTFFLKATGLERVGDEIYKIREDIREAKDKFKASKDMKKEKHATLHKLETTVAALKALDKHEGEIQNCLAKMFWCDVEEAQSVVNGLEDKKREQLKNLRSAEKRLSAEEKKRENIGSIDESTAIIEELVLEQDELEKEFAIIARTLKEKTIEESRRQTALQILRNNLDTHQQRLVEVREDIAARQAASMKDAAEEERVILEKINNCRVSLEQTESDYAQANETSRVTADELDQVKSTISNMTRQRDHIHRALTDSKREMNDMKRGGASGRVNRFHSNMSKAVAEIKAASFQNEVHGPLGMEILLKDEHKRLGSAVEKGLWRSLSSFVVNSGADRLQLSGILKKHQLHTFSQIFLQSKRPRYNVNLNREVPGTVYLLDAIHVENDTVFNVLVDQNRIDQVIITQTERESDEKFVTVIGGKRQFKTGINQAITMDGRTISYKDGNKASEQSNYPCKNLLAADTSEIIASLTTNISRDEIEIADISAKIQATSHELSKLEKQRQQDESNVRCLSKDVQRLRKLFEDLQREHSDIQSTNTAGSNDLDDLVAEENDLIDAISEVERRYESDLGDVKAAKQDMKDCLADKKRLESKKRNLQKKRDEQQELIENHINSIENLTRNVDKANRDVVKQQKVVSGVELLISEKEKVVEEKTEVARARTPEHLENWNGEPLSLSKNDNRDSLFKQINKLKGRIEEGKRKAGLEGYTLDILTTRLNVAMEDYTKFQQDYNTVKRRIKEMDRDAVERIGLWNSQVKMYGKMVSRGFDTYMQKRGFSGTVEFDHENKLLTVKSQTDNANIDTRCSDLRQMSGGERSYTALCLLLALGHVIECPFRLMDEYDVFLDQMARKFTLDILAAYARDPVQKGRQFIIITPQDLRHMTTSDEVRIHKMPDPERIHTGVAQQQTLNF